MNQSPSSRNRPADDERWRVIAERDRSMDGQFVYAVRTSGVYCRPSCPGRPHRVNVAFYDDPQAACADGFRACKRCRPDGAAKGRRIIPDEAIRFAFGRASIGSFAVASSGRGVRAIFLGDCEDQVQRELQSCFAGAELREDPEGLKPLGTSAIKIEVSPVRSGQSQGF